VIRSLCAFLAACALVCLVQTDAQPQQPKQPKKKVVPKKADPNAGPPARAAEFVGVWKVVRDSQKYEEEFTVAYERGWVVTGVYKVGGKEVGRFHGNNIALMKVGLRFTYVIDEKPPFDVPPNTTGVLSAKEDKGTVSYRSVGEKSTYSWRRSYERTEKGKVAAAPMPKAEPKLEPKPEPKTEPKTGEVEQPAGPYSVVATVKGVHTGALSPDGQTLYALSLEFNARGLIAYDLKKKEVVKRVKLSFPDRVRVSDDGKVVAVCDYQNFGQKDNFTKVLLYDAATLEPVAEFDHPKAAGLLAISADGGRVAVGSHGFGPADQGAVTVWDVAKKKVLFTAKIAGSLAIDLSADGKTLAMSHFGPDKTQIGFINVDTGKAKAAVKGLAEHLAVSADGKFAVGSFGNKLTVYDAARKTARELPPPGVGGALQLSLIDGGKRVVTGSSVAETQVVVLATGKVEHTFKLEPERAPKGPKLPKGAKGPKAPAAKIYQAAFLRATPDSSLLLTVGADRVARVWTLPFGQK
jgi:WD40 repeat protein